MRRGEENQMQGGGIKSNATQHYTPLKTIQANQHLVYPLLAQMTVFIRIGIDS